MKIVPTKTKVYTSFFLLVVKCTDCKENLDKTYMGIFGKE
jgi:hypothetical protein